MKITIDDSVLKQIRSDMRTFQRCAEAPTAKHQDNYGCQDNCCYAVGDYARDAIRAITAALRSTTRGKGA